MSLVGGREWGSDDGESDLDGETKGRARCLRGSKWDGSPAGQGGSRSRGATSPSSSPGRQDRGEAGGEDQGAQGSPSKVSSTAFITPNMNIVRGILRKNIRVFGVEYTFQIVGCCAIFYSNTNSVQLFWENSTLNLANFTELVIFRVKSWRFYPSPKTFHSSANLPLVTRSMQTWNLSKNLRDPIFQRKNFTHWKLVNQN